MDNYEIMGALGEGSFGRVYKAKRITDAKFVALKVIGKRGRSPKEVIGLRRECKILRHLHHPNIIQMLDSFETENEIVVITEFADKELNVILAKEGYLSEVRVQNIVWDLVSALYYLHSHRVLHRDLKPQNILLDSKDCAKLCDFGFARNMSTGTHVLTSIKGTPLYMAPELIEEQPYDHNADLWSLGCIIYELLVGAPPFCTASLLHLIKLVRHEQIQWPTFISDNCISFLKGLLQKNPSKRMSWPEIMRHPFVKGHVLASENTPTMPLTRPMSANTLLAKEQQRLGHTQKKGPLTKPSTSKTEEKSNVSRTSKKSTSSTGDNKTSQRDQDLRNNNLEVSLNNLSLDSNRSKRSKTPDHRSESGRRGADASQSLEQLVGLKHESVDEEVGKVSGECEKEFLSFREDSYPIENEEWVVFLQHSVEEVMGGEMNSLCQPSQTNIIVSPLRNTNASAKVVAYVASLLSLPFVVPVTSENVSEQIRKTYFEVKLVPNLVYSSKLLMRRKKLDDSATSSNHSDSPSSVDTHKSINDLTDEELQALEYIYLLICHLAHLDVCFLTQFCDAVAILNIYGLVRKLLTLSKRKLRVVTDVLAILTQVLRRLAENSEVVSKVVSGDGEDDAFSCVDFLRHESPLLRERMCCFLMFLGKRSEKCLEKMWSVRVKETLEALVYDSVEGVRNAAETAVEELKLLSFY